MPRASKALLVASMATGAAAALLTCPQYQVQSSRASKFCKCNSKSTRKNRSFAYHPPSNFDRLSYCLTFNDLAVLELHLGFWRVDSVELFSMPGQCLSGLFSACLTFLQDSLKMHWFLEVKGLGFLYADHRNRADCTIPSTFPNILWF